MIYELSIPYKQIYIFKEIKIFNMPTLKQNLLLLRNCVQNFLYFKI